MEHMRRVGFAVEEHDGIIFSVHLNANRTSSISQCEVLAILGGLERPHRRCWRGIRQAVSQYIIHTSRGRRRRHEHRYNRRTRDEHTQQDNVQDRDDGQHVRRHAQQAARTLIHAERKVRPRQQPRQGDRIHEHVNGVRKRLLQLRISRAQQDMQRPDKNDVSSQPAREGKHPLAQRLVARLGVRRRDERHGGDDDEQLCAEIVAAVRGPAVRARLRAVVRARLEGGQGKDGGDALAGVDGLYADVAGGGDVGAPRVLAAGGGKS